MAVTNWVPTWHLLVPRAIADKMGLKPKGVHGAKSARGFWSQAGTPFAMEAGSFLSPLEVPCSKPPFGVLSAVDLRTGKIRWERPLGTMRDSGPFGIPVGLTIAMGVLTSGGALITEGGLVFVAATQGRTFRAISLADWKTLWSARLPAGGQAVPMTYFSPKSGRQLVVVAAGGKGLIQSPTGDSLVAYGLPDL